MPGPKWKRVRVVQGEGSSREEKQHKVKREERLRKGEGVESQRGRQLIRLGDDSPMLDIYSIRREGERYVTEGEPVGGRANCLGGVQDDITVLVNSEWHWRERPQ